MSDEKPDLGPAVVYTETVVHSAPEAFLGEAPYQVVMAELSDGRRVTGRIAGERVQIGDRLTFVEYRDEIPIFRRST